MSFVPIACSTPDLGSVTITGPVQIIESGGFTPVAASRWFDTDTEDISLLGVTDLTLTSPVPAAGEIIVVTDLSYIAELAVALALTSITVEVRQVSDSTVIWQSSIGFTAAATAGNISTFETSSIYVYGEAGEQIEMVLTINTGLGITASVAANFGGFIATA